MSMALSADQVLEVFGCASEENQVSPARHQQEIHLPAEGELWITGDLHDHQRNFEKLLATADLPNHPGRHLVLHELIHGDRYDASGADGSWLILYRAAELKCDYPRQVHFLLANHDLAQIRGEGIMKGGLSVCEAFNKGIRRDFGARFGPVNAAITEFLLSFPLAVRAENGLLACHSLPTDDQIPTFDYSVFGRPLTAADYKRRTGPVYQLIWGRNISPAGAAAFADAMGACILITGHQPQETGYFINGERHLIIASDHNQGVFLPLDLSMTYDMEALESRIQKFVALDLDGSDAALGGAES